jgi:hypothetical protein
LIAIHVVDPDLPVKPEIMLYIYTLMKKKNPAFSSRVHVKDEPELLQIIISGRIPSWQFTLLSGWLLAWTVAGIFVLIELFSKNSPAEQRTFMMVWLAFWAWFEYRILSAWLWRRSGREVVSFGKETSTVLFEVNGRGMERKHETARIHQLMSLEAKKGLFSKNFYSSFWVVGGETIGYKCNGAEIAFGRQLSDTEATALIKIIRHKLEQLQKASKDEN